MACYHCRAKKPISRARGQSVIAAAAYRSGEKLKDDYYGLTHDYTHKGGIIYSEVMLCKNAPREWSNRTVLWNAVEKAEKSCKAQLAREFELALPNELTYDENINLVREYVRKTFVDQGMCADIAMHDKDHANHNPHAHVLLTMRPILANGRWGEKQHKQYIYDEHGQRQYDPVKKTYKCQTIKTTNWDSVAFLENARVAWEAAQNTEYELKGLDVRVSHRSYKDRGIDQLPTVHLGTTAHRMEQKGIPTERGNINRRIRERNQRVRDLNKQIHGLAQEKERLGRLIDIEHNAKAQQSPGYAHWAKLHNLKESAKTMSFLADQGISSYKQLETAENAARAAASDARKQLQEVDRRLKQNGQLMRDIILYKQTSATYAAYKQGGKQASFMEAHQVDIDQHLESMERMRDAERQLGHKLPGMQELKAERAQLKQERPKLYDSLCVLKEKSNNLTAAKATVDVMIRREQKPSMKAKLEQYKEQVERANGISKQQTPSLPPKEPEL